MVKIIRNTYPRYPNVPHAEMGAAAKWVYDRGQYNLVRSSDNANLFATSKDNATTGLLPSGKPSKLFGIIASVKSRGWFLEVSTKMPNPIKETS